MGKASLLRKRQNSLAPNPIPFHERHHLEFIAIICCGSALAFNSGFINGCTLLTSHPQAVSHVTGTTSHAGINLALGNFSLFGTQIAIVMSFMSGASITGYWMPANSFQLGRQYGPLFLIGSVLLSFACAISYHFPESNWYFFFAAAASGLQNGMTTKYSGNIIRTTHLTGSVTDIGLVLGRIISGNNEDLWKLQVLLPITVSFFGGGFVSVYIVERMGKLSLLINVLTFFTVGLVYSIFVSYRLDISLLSAYLGSYRNAGQLKFSSAGGVLNEKMKAVVGSPNFFRNSAKASHRPKGNARGGYGESYSNSPPRKRKSSRGTLFSSEKIHRNHGVADGEIVETAVNPLHQPGEIEIGIKIEKG